MVHSHTDNMQIAELRFGRHRIYLTHISSFVLFVYIVDVQIPRLMFIVFVVGDADARITRYHMIVHCQYGRLFEMHPGYLQILAKRNNLVWFWIFTRIIYAFNVRIGYMRRLCFNVECSESNFQQKLGTFVGQMSRLKR